MNWDGQERRKFPRAAFPCKIIVNHLNKIIVAQTENIGKGGVKILLEKELQHSSLVALELELVKGKPIKCEGTVIWVRKITHLLRKEITMYSIGIMFTNISHADREYIKNFVDRLLADKERNGSTG